MKSLVLTAHALLRMHERRIPREGVERAVRAPEWIEPDPRDPEIDRRYRSIPEFGGRRLRVACVETETTVRVISVMFDRTARREP